MARKTFNRLIFGIKGVKQVWNKNVMFLVKGDGILIKEIVVCIRGFQPCWEEFCSRKNVVVDGNVLTATSTLILKFLMS